MWWGITHKSGIRLAIDYKNKNDLSMTLKNNSKLNPNMVTQTYFPNLVL